MNEKVGAESKEHMNIKTLCVKCQHLLEPYIGGAVYIADRTPKGKTMRKVQDLKRRGLTVRQIAVKLGVTRNHIYKMHRFI